MYVCIMRWGNMWQCEARLLYEANRRAVGTKDMVTVFFSSFYDQRSSDFWLLNRTCETPKRTRPIFSRLDRTSLVNKEFIICPKTKSFLSGSTRKIPSANLKRSNEGGKRRCNCLRTDKNIIWSTF